MIPPSGYLVRQGDALRLLAELPDGCVDALITDPPYSSGGQFRSDRGDARGLRKYLSAETCGTFPPIEGDSRDQRAYLAWCTMWLAEAWRCTRVGGVVVVATDWRQLPTTTDALQCAGWVWRGILPWSKPGARPQPGRFTQAAEFFAWGSRGPMPLEGAPLPGEFRCTAPREREHPTEKPLEVMRQLVRCAPGGGLVADPFAGSGTTLVAALAEGRRAIGFELSAEYSSLAERRCADVVAGRARFEPVEQGGLFGVGR